MLPIDYVNYDNFCLLVTDLKPNTTRTMLWNTFTKLGSVKQIELRLKEGNASATVLFVSKIDDDTYSGLKIDGHPITATPMPTLDLLNTYKRDLPAQSFSMGVLPSLNAFIQEYVNTHRVSLEVNFYNFLEVKFIHVDAHYRIRIPLSSLKTQMKLQRKENITSLNLSLKYPGYFYRFDEQVEEWVRVTHMPMDLKYKKQFPISTDNKNSLDISHWNAYRIEFDIPQKTHDYLRNMLEVAYKNIKSQIPQRSTMIQVYKPPSNNVRQQIQDIIQQFPFKVQYMIQHALQLRILNYYNINARFCQTMRDLPPSKAEQILMLMTKQQVQIYTLDETLKTIWENVKYTMNIGSEGAGEDVGEEGYVKVRKVVITPTCIYPLQPVTKPINLIQQQFPDHLDRFLIVQFTDEEFQPLAPTKVGEVNSAIYDRVFDIMKYGVSVAGRRFDFLCTSPELLTEHTCWFFAPTLDLSIPKMIDIMGGFDDIDNLTDYIEATGQFLAQPILSFPVKKEEVEITSDVDIFGHNFTKGCGKISPYFLRDIIANALDLNYTPSVIEFHLAGSKGILHISNYLKGRRIEIRDSQIFYNTDKFRFEVLSYSKPEKVFLDRHRILVLSSLGISQTVFIKLLEDMMDRIEKPYTHCMINDYYTSRGIFHDFDRIMMSKFLERDPFIGQLFTMYQHELIKNLHDNAKIHIPEGAKCYAIMDETGTLESDEIFFQTMDEMEDPPTRRTIIGHVLIYGDSSCSPDDVRVFSAIECEKLKHVTNVIVFSSKQSLGLPSLISNDPKDGNHFTVIWNNDLIPIRHKPRPSHMEPALMKVKPTRKEAIKFMVQYMSNDHRQEIEKAFIAKADRDAKGAMAGTTLFLARQLALALDFNRSGIPGKVPDHLKEYPQPDIFSDAIDYQTYTSKSVLGHIYHMTENSGEFDFPSISATYDKRLFHQEMRPFIADARRLRDRYDFELRMILSEYSLFSELELVSGCVHRYSSYIPRQSSDYIKGIRQAYQDLRHRWRYIFEQGENHLEKAAAWYYVVYHPSEIQMRMKNEDTTLFYSFAWIADDYLCDMALFHIEMEKKKEQEQQMMLPELDGLIITNPNEE